jgi:hypothetical protein
MDIMSGMARRCVSVGLSPMTVEDGHPGSRLAHRELSELFIQSPVIEARSSSSHDTWPSDLRVPCGAGLNQVRCGHCTFLCDGSRVPRTDDQGRGTVWSLPSEADSSRLAVCNCVHPVFG